MRRATFIGWGDLELLIGWGAESLCYYICNIHLSTSSRFLSQPATVPPSRPLAKASPARSRRQPINLRYAVTYVDSAFEEP